MERSRGVARLGFGGAAGGGGLPLLLLVLFLSAAAATSEADLEKRGGGSVPVDSTKDGCNYTILIETTCTKGAGTTDQVSLRFGDSNSTDILVRRLRTKHPKWVDELDQMVLDDVPRVPFQECSTDVFKVTGKCIHSQICYFYLKHRGDDDWRPGQAQVLVIGAAKAKLSSNSFYFRRFLPRRVWHGVDNCEAEVTPFGLRHPRRVFGSEHESKLP